MKIEKIRIKVNKLVFCGIVSSIALSGLSTNVLAQTGATALEEIIVTARKREEKLLDAPLAVSVFSAAEIENAGYQNILDIAKATPGLFIEKNNDQAARVNSTPRFRGIFLSTGNPLQQTASVFLDGIYMTGGTASLGVNELQRVEIIKGPQSALFGRNTFAGAINYVTKDPSEEFRADINVLAATRDEYNIAFGVEGPIIPGVLSGRLGLSSESSDGHYDNSEVPGENLGDESQWDINASLLFTPNDDLRVKFRASYREVDDGAPAIQQLRGINSHNTGGFLITDADGNVDLNDSVFPAPRDGTRTESVYAGTIVSPTGPVGLNSGFDVIERWRSGYLADGRYDAANPPALLKYNLLNQDEWGLQSDLTRISLSVDYDISENIGVSFLAGFNEEAFGYWNDFDNSADDSFSSYISREVEDYSYEARLFGNSFNDRLHWSIGASVVDIEILGVSGTANFLFNPIYFGDIFRADPFITGAKTTGIFGTLDYQISDQFSASLELRSQEDEISDGDVNDGLAVPISPGTIDSTLPRVTLRYQPADNSTIYLNYSEGNLPGGFNPQVGELDAVQLAELISKAPGAGVTFGEEKLTNLELGWKYASEDGTYAFNLAAFIMERSDEIFRSIETTIDTSPGAPNPERTVAFNANGATTDIYGIELDGSWVVNDNLTLSGSFAYIDSAIASFPAGAGSGDFGDIFGDAADVAGQEAPRFPPIMFSLSGTYERPFSGIANFNSWYARGDMYYSGHYYSSNANVAEVADAVDANLRVGLRHDSASIEFFISNLLDEDAPASAFNFADVTFDTRLRPGGFFDFTREGQTSALRDKRQFGIRMNYTF